MAMQTQPPTKPVIWLATDEASKPYMHTLDGECDCPICESKKSQIILTQ